MLRAHTFLSVTLASLILLISTNIYAQQAKTTETTTTTTTQTSNGPVTVEKRVITTTVPAPKEVIETPTGYVSCATIPAGWVDANWVTEHKVCKYENATEGVAWVDSYWSCTQYKIDTGECTNWLWVAAHWEKTYSIY
jgi:hypothetical protein